MAATAANAPVWRAGPQESGTIRIGVLTDLSGPDRDITGPTSVACLHQAVEDFGVSGKGFTVEVLAADHRNKPNLGADIARYWFDHDGVDVIMDVPSAPVALAVNTIVKDRNKVYINTGCLSAELTGALCTGNTVHWSCDTAMIAVSTGDALTKAGGDTWYFIAADYAFCQQLKRDTVAAVQRAGDRVLGTTAYPFPATWNFTAILQQAKASGAKVIALASAAEDTATCVRQARELRLTDKAKLAALLGSLTMVHGIGLDVAQGLLLTESFYWDMNPRTRAWMDRLRPKTPSNYPNEMHAGVYAGALHYLKVVAELGAARAKQDGAATVARMKATPTLDDCYGAGKIRADGRYLCPAYLFEVKKPIESVGEWDLYKLVGTTPADKAAAPESACAITPA
jgi:branched-chain amino acid transport system substrate-binding protein